MLACHAGAQYWCQRNVAKPFCGLPSGVLRRACWLFVKAGRGVRCVLRQGAGGAVCQGRSGCELCAKA